VPSKKKKNTKKEAFCGINHSISLYRLWKAKATKGNFSQAFQTGYFRRRSHKTVLESSRSNIAA
jgi:hypothetical protein